MQPIDLPWLAVGAGLYRGLSPFDMDCPSHGLYCTSQRHIVCNVIAIGVLHSLTPLPHTNGVVFGCHGLGALRINLDFETFSVSLCL